MFKKGQHCKLDSTQMCRKDITGQVFIVSSLIQPYIKRKRGQVDKQVYLTPGRWFLQTDSPGERGKSSQPPLNHRPSIPPPIITPDLPKRHLPQV